MAFLAYVEVSVTPTAAADGERKDTTSSSQCSLGGWGMASPSSSHGGAKGQVGAQDDPRDHVENKELPEELEGHMQVTCSWS